MKCTIRRGALAAGFAVVALLGAACGAPGDPTASAPKPVAPRTAGPAAVDLVGPGLGPMLTTLVSAVSGKLDPKANLVDTPNANEFTVFAPVGDAFAEADAT